MNSGSFSSHPKPPAPTVDASVIERGRSLAAVVLLAGAVRPSDLQRATGRSILDLPLTADRTIAHEWARREEEFRRAVGRADLPLLITANAAAGAPQSLATSATNGSIDGIGTDPGPAPIIRMDTDEPRGSGGSLRDLAIGFDPAGRLFVASGHSLPRTSLIDVYSTLSRSDDDVVIHTDAASRPTGFFLIRCGCLQRLPAVGFVDLKEQALPELASDFRVGVVSDAGLPPIPIRTLHGYLAAVGELAAPAASEAERAAPAEDWMCTFALAEPGASVDPSARLHDSVVLSGASVRSRANVVRSLIGPGGSVGPGQSVFDELLPGGEQRK